MIVLPDHFTGLLSNIQPSPKRIGLAQKIPDLIRNYLQSTDLIATVNPHSRLVGSYARNTAIKDIKDVDIIVFANSSYRKDKDNNPNTLLDDLVTALRELPRVLGDEFGYIDTELFLRRQRRSVHVCITLEEEPLDIDIVPAVLKGEIDETLWVPDKDWNKWIESNPLGYGKYLSGLNKKHGGKVIPLVKMLKQWRDTQMIYRRPKSYWLECLIVNYVEDDQIIIDDKSHAEIFANLLKEIFDNYSNVIEKENKVPIIPDPMLRNNVAWNWERPEFETFMRRVDESRKWVEKALNCEEEEDCIKQWQKVFNKDGEEYFPSSIDGTLKALLKASKEGSLRYTPTGLILPKPSPDVQPRESPPHRFYGLEDE